MEFPKQERDTPAIVKGKNNCMCLEIHRDHPVLVQHSKFHTQGWRANGDISLILSKSETENPSVEDIIATEKYVTGYACKGNQPTGELSNLFEDLVNTASDLFEDQVNTADETTGATTKFLCTKLLMGSVKRDISSVEASYKLSSTPLYRSSHQFQSVSVSGSRLLEKGGTTVTKCTTVFDKYICHVTLVTYHPFTISFVNKARSLSSMAVILVHHGPLMKIIVALCFCYTGRIGVKLLTLKVKIYLG